MYFIENEDYIKVQPCSIIFVSAESSLADISLQDNLNGYIAW